jgi:hypothetical protein
MNPLPDTMEFRDVAKRVIWFEPPDIALRDLFRFMAYAFRYASHEDMQHLRTRLSDEDLRSILTKVPSGIIDPRSWSFWHAILGVYPAPPQPKRNLESSRNPLV